MGQFLERAKNIRIQNPEKIQKSLAVTAFSAQILFLLQYCFGFVELYGKKVSLIQAIDFLMNIFSQNKIFSFASFARALLGAIWGGLYFAFLIALLKNVIISIKYCRAAYKGNDEKDTETAFNYLLDRFGKSFFKVILFIVLTRMINEFTLGTNACFLLIVGCIVYLLSRCFFILWKTGELLLSLYRLMCNFIFAIAVFAFTLFVCNADIQTMIPDVKYMMWMISPDAKSVSNAMIADTIFYCLVQSVFYIILQIMSLRIINESLAYMDYTNSESRKLSKGIVIVSSVLIALALIVSVYRSQNLNFAVLQNYISLLACAVAMLLTFMFPTFESKQNSTKENSPVADASMIKETQDTE